MNPNAIEAIRKLNRAVGLLSRRDPGDEGRAMRLTKEIDALIAAAEKPAESPNSSVPRCTHCGSRYCADHDPSEKPAEAAPVAPLPWVVRQKENGRAVAAFFDVGLANDFMRDMRPLSDGWEVAAAPPVAAVGRDFAEERDRWLALADKWQADPSLDGNAAFEAGVMAVIGRVRAAAKALAAVGRTA